MVPSTFFFCIHPELKSSQLQTPHWVHQISSPLCDGHPWLKDFQLSSDKPPAAHNGSLAFSHLLFPTTATAVKRCSLWSITTPQQAPPRLRPLGCVQLSCLFATLMHILCFGLCSCPCTCAWCSCPWCYSASFPLIIVSGVAISCAKVQTLWSSGFHGCECSPKRYPKKIPIASPE